jgi:hypothetical protein
MPFVLTAILTKAGVAHVEARRWQYRIWDKEVRGLYVRVFPNGRKVYELSSDQGPMTLGHHPMLSPTSARKRAKALSRPVAIHEYRGEGGEKEKTLTNVT